MTKNHTSHLIMLTGLPSSGKSKIANDYKNMGYKVHSSDELRIELFGDVKYQNNNGKLFEELRTGNAFKPLESGRQFLSYGSKLERLSAF